MIPSSESLTLTEFHVPVPRSFHRRVSRLNRTHTVCSFERPTRKYLPCRRQKRETASAVEGSYPKSQVSETQRLRFIFPLFLR